MSLSRILEIAVLRLLYMVAMLALVCLGVFAMYMAFQWFMHTSYWLVVAFLILIALSNGLVYFVRLFLTV